MNRKKILIALISLFVVTVFFTVLQQTQKQDVRIYLEEPDITVSIYREGGDGSPVHTLSTSSTISLPEGPYAAVPSGEKADSTPIRFNVGDETSTVSINPPYRASYLSQVLEGEKNSLHNVITNEFPSIISEYDINTGSLFQKGEWYGTVLSYDSSDPREERDTYRVVLKQTESGDWAIAAGPEIVLTSFKYPDVPLSVLVETNTLLID